MSTTGVATQVKLSEAMREEIRTAASEAGLTVNDWLLKAAREKLARKSVVNRPPRWRTGRTVGRAIYLGDQLVGLMDTRELADQMVAALNAGTAVARQPSDAAVEAVLRDLALWDDGSILPYFPEDEGGYAGAVEHILSIAYRADALQTPNKAGS